MTMLSWQKAISATRSRRACRVAMARSRRLANVKTWDYHYGREGQIVGCTQATRLLVITTEMYLDTYTCDHCGQTVEKKRSESHT
jgi:hypothetical protein